MTEQAIDSRNDLDTLCINTLRMLAVDMVEKADSGHPGLPMGAAAIAYTLWTRHLRCNPQNPAWPDRDRFVLSAGHGSALLYALLHLAGYDLPLEQIKHFRQWGSRAPGHPERGETPGVEVTTGPLGQGVANAVGLAMAEAWLAARFNRDGLPLVNHFTYGLCSDGDLMEGVAAEAVSLAGHLGLGKLILLYDDNLISLAAGTRITFTEDVGVRFAACGWQVLDVADGNDVAAIDQALAAAKAETSRPSLLRVRTHIGFGSPHKQDSCEAHGSPLGAEEVAATKHHLGWPLKPAFHIPPEALARFRQLVDTGRLLERKWDDLLGAYAQAYPAAMAEWRRYQAGELPPGWDEEIPVFAADHKPIATRSAGGEVLNAIARKVGNLIGGSADLDPSTKTALKGRGSFQAPGSGDDSVEGSPGGEWSYRGANIAFGVREHAMGGILNGMAAHGGIRPFGATFFIFSDYLRPSLRLAALSRLPVKYVFTHDSVALGEDGPTHQPIEQLASLRAMPNLTVIRPADGNEVAEAWRVAMRIDDGPVALVFSRQDLPILDRGQVAPASGLARGGYVLLDPPGPEAADLILIASGSEVHTALAARERLTEEGWRVRVVSLPSWELFAAQPQDYRDQVLPPQVSARIAIEAAASFGWERYVGPGGQVIGIDRFGASAPGAVNLEKLGISAAAIVAAARSLLA
ncbi:transketolase [Desulfuromonas carbonis]|uniref:transketolase n=1 Tax=Desulfuromonas sp. DDH964 TaxID=1823759 RepID=UPI00078BAB1E|nr:transketolase [Desulfuromonas sp. DDH964]AMV72869.1 transketolase [Desulfuromonas sp. DDH964]